MNAEQTVAFAAFIATLSPRDCAALMDMTSSHMANVNESLELNEQEPSDHEGYDILAAIDNALIVSVAVPVDDADAYDRSGRD